MPTEIETLKPCPFCSGPAAICNREMAGCTYIACDDCGASCEDGSLEIAAARWNRRALDSPIGEQGVGVDPTELHQIGMTLNFLACVIKSGEAWTGTCQREFNAAHACLSQVRSAISPERKEPVAWARRFEGRWLYTRITRVAEIWREQGCEVQPLYATPEQPT